MNVYKSVFLIDPLILLLCISQEKEHICKEGSKAKVYNSIVFPLCVCTFACRKPETRGKGLRRNLNNKICHCGKGWLLFILLDYHK